MQFLAFPFALLLFGKLYDHFSIASSIVRSHLFLITISVTSIFCSWALSASAPLSQIAGGIKSKGSEVGQITTPAQFRTTGLIVDELRQELGLETIVFVTPDIGGVGLCCSRIRVVDIGLLANHRLGQGGYSVLPQVLRSERPDVIEVHGAWSTYSRIYDLPVFIDNYKPAFIGGTRLYLRTDRARELVAQGYAKWCKIDDVSCSKLKFRRHRYARSSTKDDDRAFLTTGKVLVGKI
jgi:hypothetical protein